LKLVSPRPVRWQAECAAAGGTGVTLAAMLISWLRMLPVTAVACPPPAATPTARVRLSAIAASTSHAELAMKFPDGK